MADFNPLGASGHKAIKDGGGNVIGHMYNRESDVMFTNPSGQTVGWFLSDGTVTDAARQTLSHPTSSTHPRSENACFKLMQQSRPIRPACIPG